MADRKPLTGLRPSQVQRPVPAKVYGKKRARYMMADELFFDDAFDSRFDLKADKENDHLAEDLESLALEDAAGPSQSAAFDNHISTLCALSGPNSKVKSFKSFSRDLEKSFKIVKIADGTFADVFSLRSKEDESNEIILKVLAIRRPDQRSRNGFSKVSEIIREVSVSRLLSSLPGFTDYRDVAVVKGKYPKAFLDASSALTEAYRPHPELTFDSPDQLFAILELRNAGKDGETLIKPSAFAARDVFWQCALIFENAEHQLCFEHRDLHISNLCFSKWDPEGPEDVTKEIVAQLKDTSLDIAGISNIRPTVIDYTLSRSNKAQGGSKEDCFFNESATFSRIKPRKEETEESKQVQAYRRTHRCIMERYKAEKLAEAPRYSVFAPKTNVSWLMYLLAVLYGRGKCRIVANGLGTTQLQVDAWAVLEDILKTYGGDEKECPVKMLPESCGDLIRVGIEGGWVSVEEIEVYRARFDGE